MLFVLEPRYKVPDRKTFATNYIPKLYEQEKSSIHEQLQGVQNYSIKTDMWTSCANYSYISLTIHYISPDSFTLRCHLLETCEFSETHTGVHIAEELKSIIDSWKLPSPGLVAATTDNGSNVVLAMECLEYTRVPCFSHTLQLAVEDALKIPEIAKMISRCKRLVAHFNHSSKSYYVLRQKQIDLHYKQLHLVQDVQTRWNSSYYMVERISQQQQPLCVTLLEIKKVMYFLLMLSFLQWKFFWRS